jgi:hypothetical protein
MPAKNTEPSWSWNLAQQPTEIVNQIFEINRDAGPDSFLQIHNATTVLLSRHIPFSEVIPGELKATDRVKVASVCRVYRFRVLADISSNIFQGGGHSWNITPCYGQMERCHSIPILSVSSRTMVQLLPSKELRKLISFGVLSCIHHHYQIQRSPTMPVAYFYSRRCPKKPDYLRVPLV